MRDEDPEDGKPEGMSELRALATLRDLDRRMMSQGTRLFMTRWLLLPMMLIVLVGLVVGLVMGFGNPGPVIGGVLAVAGGAAGIAEWARRQADDLRDVQEERRCLLHDHPSLGAGDPRSTRGVELDSSSGADSK
jgi:hypothetical protein